MNKQTYRLIFSKLRGMLIAVEETATGTGEASQGAVVVGQARPCSGQTVSRFALRHAAFAALLLLGVVPVLMPLTSEAQVVAAPGSGAKVIQTQSGLPQVNIARPSNSGVSLNTYSQFDVQKPGVILNNSPVIVQTQQAGYINGNPNLSAGQSASIIVNQVNSNSPSQLNGYVEVAGSKAEVVIANPSGLIVGGGGFINTSRAILTTGSPIVDANGTSASSTVFNEQTSAVIGQYIATLTQMTLVTGSGDFSTLGLGNDMQLTGQSANGFTFGLGGSPGVLQATLISTDISGQPIGSVANDVIGGVGHTLTGDTSAMPAGSIRYSMEVTTTTPMLVVNRGSSAGSSTLAQLQQDFGGTIATLGDVSYLSGMSASAPASAYAEISGVLYPATYVATGQPVPEFLLNGIELAYNQTAATFIVQELKTHASVLGVGTV